MTDPIRTQLDNRLARVRALGWRGLLEIEGATLRRLVKTTFAATVAWELATLLHSPRPVLAALGAILVVQVTVRASLSRSIQLTLAVTVGLGGAIVLGQLLGLHWWSVALVVLAGLVLGEILRLGPFSSQAAISALLALSLGSGYGYARMWDTALGAAVGVLVNIVIAPPTHVRQASDKLRRLGEDVAALLHDIGTGLQDTHDLVIARRWLARARELAADARRTAETVEQGEESVRFNPRGRAEMHTLQRLDEGRRALDHCIVQLRGITRSLLGLHESAPDAADLEALRLTGTLLIAAGRQVAAFGRLQQEPGSVPWREQAVAEHAAALVARDAVIDALRRIGPSEDDTARQLSAMLVDAERLLHEVDVVDGAHSTAVTT